MSRFRVLVVSDSESTGHWLGARLDAHRFDVAMVTPGPLLPRTIREHRPHLAVLDGIDARPGTAPMEVALLKESSAGVLIVVCSGQSSERDGDVIELGVSCYLADQSLDELLRVIEMAALQGRTAAPVQSGEPQQRSHA